MARDVLRGALVLPPLPSLDCVMALQRGGFVVTTIVSDRIVLRRPNRMVVVPRHRVLHPAELTIILRMAGIEEDAFVELLAPLAGHASGVRSKLDPSAVDDAIRAKARR